MTMHQTIVDAAQAVPPLPDLVAKSAPLQALPAAPLAMPKQVLTHDVGAVRRLVGFAMARIGWAKPGIRRAS